MTDKMRIVTIALAAALVGAGLQPRPTRPG